MIRNASNPPQSDSDRAREFYKQGHFEQALPLYQEICRSEQANGWDVYFMANCLYKLGRHAGALDGCRRAWRMFPEPRPDALRNLCGWCVYQCDLKPLVPADSEDVEESESDHQPEEGQSNRIQKATKAATTICEITTQANGSPYAKGVLTISKILKRAGRWQQVEEWTGHIDPTLLSREPWTPPRKDAADKVREIASDLETWYGYRTKALTSASSCAINTKNQD